MSVLAAYGLQTGRYRITQMAKQKKQYDNTNDIDLDVWRSVLLAALGMAHLAGGGPPVAASGYGTWRTLARASGIIGDNGQR
jgi:hypothetical protein